MQKSVSFLSVKIAMHYVESWYSTEKNGVSYCHYFKEKNSYINAKAYP